MIQRHQPAERIVYWLSLFAERLNRQHSAEMVREYVRQLSDLTAEEIDRAGALLYAREAFTPPPDAFRKAARPAGLDTDRLLLAIQALGEYHPHGWRYPFTEHVARVMGAGIAAAYAQAGSARLYAENETTRHIARLEFATAAEEAPPEELKPWLVGAKPERLALPPAERPALPPKAGDWGESPRALIEHVADSRRAWREQFRKAGALPPQPAD